MQLQRDPLEPALEHKARPVLFQYQTEMKSRVGIFYVKSRFLGYTVDVPYSSVVGT